MTKKGRKSKKVVSLYLNEAIVSMAKTRAEEDGKNLSSLVDALLEEYLDYRNSTTECPRSAG
jgi:hypothetical protein